MNLVLEVALRYVTGLCFVGGLVMTVVHWLQDTESYILIFRGSVNLLYFLPAVENVGEGATSSQDKITNAFVS